MGDYYEIICEHCGEAIEEIYDEALTDRKEIEINPLNHNCPEANHP